MPATNGQKLPGTPGTCCVLYRRLSATEAEAQGRESVAVAVRSKHLLATAFHPELTDDLRWCANAPMVLPHEAV